MPPRKAAAVPLGLTTRHRTRSSRTQHEESPTKKARLEPPSTDESDIEVDIEDSTSQRTAHSLPIPAGQHDYDDDAPESGANLYPAGPADCICALDSFAAVTAFLRSRLLNTFSTQAASMALRPALQEVYTNLLSLLSSTAETPGANHSFLLLGARGTGKSMVMQRVLAAIHAKYNPDDSRPVVGFVRLTGLAHTEDVVAFREIARQLCKCFNFKFSKVASLAENLDFLRTMLQQLARSHKVVIFVLDEFDLFAKKAKQTTLYNLLDAMQSAGMQAAVVGLSCRHDVMELLEKRVRSRFSHRKQLLPELEQKDFDQPGNSPKDVLASMLTVPETGSSDAPAAEPVQEWNAAVSHVLATDAVAGQLKLMVNQGSGTPRDLADVATDAVLCMDRQPRALQQSAVLAGIASVRQVCNQQADIVGSCSVLELFMLVAMYRIKRRGSDSANFEMVHDEYYKLMQQGSTGDRRSKAAALRAFERLIASGLIAYVDSRAEEKGGLREFHSARVTVLQQEIDTGLKLQKSCPGLLKSALAQEAVRGSFAH